MPRTTREYMRRRTQQTIGAIDRALYHLGEEIKTYGEDHPTYTMPLLAAAEGLETIKEVLNRFLEEKQ